MIIGELEMHIRNKVCNMSYAQKLTQLHNALIHFEHTVRNLVYEEHSTIKPSVGLPTSEVISASHAFVVSADRALQRHSIAFRVEEAERPPKLARGEHTDQFKTARLAKDGRRVDPMANLPSPVKAIVLIVEDEPIARMFAADVVKKAGFKVLEAGNADEAVRILESRTDIRIVFTDIDMPGSMDGLKLAAAIRGRWPPIEIVITSGHRNVSLSELPERSIFFPKPYGIDRVVATLRKLAA
jgi:CheY-like chemotaxis protein